MAKMLKQKKITWGKKTTWSNILLINAHNKVSLHFIQNEMSGQTSGSWLYFVSIDMHDFELFLLLEFSICVLKEKRGQSRINYAFSVRSRENIVVNQ